MRERCVLDSVRSATCARVFAIGAIFAGRQQTVTITSGISVRLRGPQPPFGYVRDVGGAFAVEYLSVFYRRRTQFYCGSIMRAYVAPLTQRGGLL